MKRTYKLDVFAELEIEVPDGSTPEDIKKILITELEPDDFDIEEVED